MLVFNPRRHLGQSRDTFAFHTYGAATDIQWAKVGSPAVHPVPRSAVTMKNLVPKVHIAEMGN